MAMAGSKKRSYTNLAICCAQQRSFALPPPPPRIQGSMGTPHM